jgi:hypothetical protein
VFLGGGKGSFLERQIAMSSLLRRMPHPMSLVTRLHAHAHRSVGVAQSFDLPEDRSLSHDRERSIIGTDGQTIVACTWFKDARGGLLKPQKGCWV